MAQKKVPPQRTGSRATRPGSSNQRHELKARQQAATRHQRRTRLIAIVAGAVVVALVLVAIVVFHPSAPTPVPPPPTVTSTEQPTSTGPFIPPDGTAAMGWIQVPSANTKPGALVVDEHLDYQCPWCELAEQFYGPALQSLAERGDIVWRIHIRTMVGDRMLNNDSSQRAAMAATCADVVGDFIAYHDTIFANQPTTEGTGYTDQQLRVDFAQKAGITGDKLTQFQACYDTQKTLPYVQAMEQVNWNSTTINGGTNSPVQGTPAFFVNGTPMDFGSMLGQDANKNIVPAIDTSPDGLLAYLKTAAG